MLPYSEISRENKTYVAGCRKEWAHPVAVGGALSPGCLIVVGIRQSSSIDATVKFDPLIGRVWHKAEKPHTLICGGVSPKGRQFKTDAAWL